MEKKTKKTNHPVGKCCIQPIPPQISETMISETMIKSESLMEYDQCIAFKQWKTRKRVGYRCSVEEFLSVFICLT